MNFERDNSEKTPADIITAPTVDGLIRILKPLGSDCAEVFVRARLYKRSLVETAARMRISVDGVRACLEKADLQFLRWLEKIQKGNPHRVPNPAMIHAPNAALKGYENIYREALFWVSALESQEDIPAHWSQFDAWLKRCPQHEEAYRRVKAALTEAELLGNELQGLGKYEEAFVDEMSLRLRPSLKHAVFRAWLPVAATSALVLIGFAVFWNVESKWSSYTTSLEPRVFTLADGSILRLDAGTVVRVRINPTHREIVLERGQVFCDVRHEWWRAFYVFVNRNAVRDIGTKFAVIRKNASESETLVTQGAVQVLSVSDTKSSEADPVVIRSGESVLINAEGMRFDGLSSGEVDRRLAWVHGQIYINGTLEQAIEAFNRYNRQQLIIDDPNIRDVPVLLGFYDARSPDQFAKDLWRSHHIAYTLTRSFDSREGIIHLRSTP